MKLDDLYSEWQVTPTPQNLRKVVDTLDPDINKAISAHIGKPSPSIKAHAKLLAAKAIRTYDPQSQTKLRSWVHVQMQPLKRFGRQLSPLPVPERLMRQLNELKRTEQDWMDNYGREPSDQELSDTLGVSIKALNRIRSGQRITLSEGPLRGDASSDPTFGVDVIAVGNGRAAETLDIVYYSLTPQEQLVMDFRLGLHGKPKLSNNDIAKRLRISPSSASQLANSIASKLEEVESYGG